VEIPSAEIITFCDTGSDGAGADLSADRTRQAVRIAGCFGAEIQEVVPGNGT
jgi:hypothetical protein